MKVRAIAKGWFGNRLREEDEVFEVPEGSKATWFTPVTGKKTTVQIEETKAPTTLDEAKKLTNPELQKLLADEEVVAPEGSTKADMAKLLMDTLAKKAAANNAAEDLV